MLTVPAGTLKCGYNHDAAATLQRVGVRELKLVATEDEPPGEKDLCGKLPELEAQG